MNQVEVDVTSPGGQGDAILLHSVPITVLGGLPLDCELASVPERLDGQVGKSIYWRHVDLYSKWL